jgi:hypothetical protein
MTHCNIARRLHRLEQRAAACDLPEGSPSVPSPEVLSTLSSEELVQLYRQRLRPTTTRSWRDQAEAERLRRLTNEELDRLYQEKQSWR